MQVFWSKPWTVVYDCLNVGVAFHCIAASLVSTKFVHSEKATKFCEISILLLSYVLLVKSKVEISQLCCGLFRIYIQLFAFDLVINAVFFGSIFSSNQTRLRVFCTVTRVLFNNLNIKAVESRGCGAHSGSDLFRSSDRCTNSSLALVQKSMIYQMKCNMIIDKIYDAQFCFYLFLGPRFEAYGVDGGSFSETNFCQRPYLSHKFHLNQL